MHRHSAWKMMAALAALLTAVAIQSAHAQTFRLLYSFTGGSDGGYPLGGLLFDKEGNLYGTTGGGGAQGYCTGGYGCGTVFKLTPSGAETVVYSFTGSPDGNGPWAGLVFGNGGDLYGTTYEGGTSGNCDGGCGTVFRVTPAGKEKVLHSFTDNPNGAGPRAGLVVGGKGNMYGTTTGGGDYPSGGTVFKVTSSGEYKVLHRFVDGHAGSYAGLTLDDRDNLYGTFAGAGDDYGTVFRETTSGEEKVLYRFQGPLHKDGYLPMAGLSLDARGNLYGTTVYGGPGGYGTVFKLTPSGKESVLYSFTNNADGGNPQAGLVRDAHGNLYGTTVWGGTYGCGTVFKVTPSGKETVLYSFADDGDGASPMAGLIFDDKGNLYGTTAGGCVDGDSAGTVFEITP